MITDFQKKLFNYVIDTAITYFATWHSSEAKFDDNEIDTITHVFQKVIDREEDFEVETLIPNGQTYKRLTYDERKMAQSCVEDAMKEYRSHYGTCRIEIREHRVKLREIVIRLISNRYREYQLQGLAKIHDHIKKEKDALKYEGL